MSDVKISVGADPEVFIQNETLGKIVPCVGVIPGTKDNPAILPHTKPSRTKKSNNKQRIEPNISLSDFLYMDGVEAGDITQEQIQHYKSMHMSKVRRKANYDSKGTDYYMQEDNVMAEFNIPPCETPNLFKIAINTALERLKDQLPKDIVFSNRSYWVFNEEELRSPQAQTIGCAPDFDAYNMGRPRTNTNKITNERWCGGHIHMGGAFQCPDFVAALFLEWSIMANNGIRSQDFKSWYRMPGNFRPKPYGIEYRTPSNAWLWDPKMTQKVATSTLSTSKYLSTNEASAIQKAFRLVDWFQFRELLTEKNETSLRDFYCGIRDKGFPL